MAEGGRLPPEDDDEDWVQIDEDVQYDRRRRLGGPRSTVYFGKFTNKAKGTVAVAIKFIRLNNSSKREAQYLLGLNHPNVIKLYHCNKCKVMDYDFYVATEYCETSLEELMKEKPDYCREHCREIFLSVVEGLKRVHVGEIVHRDIKPSNILVNGDGYVVIADFGFSKKIDDVHQLSTCSDQVKGCFIPPEMLQGQKASSMGDLHSAGAVLFWLITGGSLAYDFVIEDGRTQHSGEPKLNKIDIDFHHDYELAKDLLSGLLKENPSDRIRYCDIVRHALFLSDVEKIEFIKKLYTAVEDSPNYQRDGRKKKSVKQYLNEPNEEITGKDWSSNLSLTDDEIKTCGFKGNARVVSNKRCAIYRVAIEMTVANMAKEIVHSALLEVGKLSSTSSNKSGAADEGKPAAKLNLSKEPNRDNNQKQKSSQEMKPYVFDSSFSLLRLVRNLAVHENKQSRPTRSILEKIGLLKYIHRRYPKFFLHIWDAVTRKTLHLDPPVKRLRTEMEILVEGRKIYCLTDHDSVFSKEKQSPCRKKSRTPNAGQLQQTNAVLEREEPMSDIEKLFTENWKSLSLNDEEGFETTGLLEPREHHRRSASFGYRSAAPTPQSYYPANGSISNLTHSQVEERGHSAYQHRPRSASFGHHSAASTPPPLSFQSYCPTRAEFSPIHTDYVARVESFVDFPLPITNPWHTCCVQKILMDDCTYQSAETLINALTPDTQPADSPTSSGSSGASASASPNVPVIEMADTNVHFHSSNVVGSTVINGQHYPPSTTSNSTSNVHYSATTQHHSSTGTGLFINSQSMDEFMANGCEYLVLCSFCKLTSSKVTNFVSS